MFAGNAARADSRHLPTQHSEASLLSQLHSVQRVVCCGFVHSFLPTASYVAMKRAVAVLWLNQTLSRYEAIVWTTTLVMPDPAPA